VAVSSDSETEFDRTGFATYILDDDHSIFRRDCRTVYQDMTRPMSHYFIASSHNTSVLAICLLEIKNIWVGYFAYRCSGGPDEAVGLTRECVSVCPNNKF